MLEMQSAHKQVPPSFYIAGAKALGWDGLLPCGYRCPTVSQSATGRGLRECGPAKQEKEEQRDEEYNYPLFKYATSVFHGFRKLLVVVTDMS
jgi:hypothetical protein